jgi:hypothetical protein
VDLYPPSLFKPNRGIVRETDSLRPRLRETHEKICPNH